MKTFLVFGAFVLFGSWSIADAQETSVKVPRGKTIMIDAQNGAGEWTDAKSIKISDEARLYFKQSGEFVYIALEAANQPYLTTDAYLFTGGETHNLHVSAMLGERILKNGEFTPWDWWNNNGWTANAARIVNSKKERPYLPDNILEIQISRRRFAGEKWLMKFDVGIPANPVFPTGTDSKNTEKWLVVELGKMKN